MDDELALRTVAQRTLEEHGYSVLLAENGQQAIAVLRAHPEVRAVVLDLTMPVMSGDTAGPIMPLSASGCAADPFERVCRMGRIAAGWAKHRRSVHGKALPAGVLVAKVEECCVTRTAKGPSFRSREQRPLWQRAAPVARGIRDQRYPERPSASGVPIP